MPAIVNPDLVAVEYDLLGDFTCDLAIGDSSSKTFLLVELEDARQNSVIVKRTSKLTPEYSPRLERGVSQVTDWFCRLSDAERTEDYFNRFGASRVSVHGMVAVGRERDLSERERRRLGWRDHTLVDSKHMSLITFDRVMSDLRFRLKMYPESRKAANL